MIEGNTNPDWLGNQTIYEMISRRFQCFVVVVCQRIGQIATLQAGDQNISPKSATVRMYVRTDSLLYVKVPQNTQKYVSKNWPNC